MSRRGSQLMANSIRQQARMAMSDLSQPKIYLISSYDGKGNVKVNVTFDPNERPVESNWMPLGCIGVGNGWGVAVGPEIGDQVLCIFENGDFSSGVIVARLYSTQAQPMPVPSGEIWAVHKTTTSLKFLNNGDLDISTHNDLNANVAGNLNATVTGNASVSAKIASIVASTSAAITAPIINLGASGQSLLKLVTSALVTLFNNHTHNGGSIGSGVSNPPNQQMGNSHLTSTITGG